MSGFLGIVVPAPVVFACPVTFATGFVAVTGSLGAFSAGFVTLIGSLGAFSGPLSGGGRSSAGLCCLLSPPLGASTEGG